MATAARRAFREIRLLLLDVDGTLTDGGLYYFGARELAQRFHVRDGYGIKRALEAGIVLGVISGRTSEPVRARLEELGVEEVHLAVSDKRAVTMEILARHGIDPEAACFVGDDVVDLPAMRSVGLAVAVADAHPAVQAEADHVTRLPGGYGAVREVIDLLLDDAG